VTQKTERRYYFRINDIIGLAYTVLDASEEFSPGNSEGMEIQLANVLTEIDTEFSRVVNTIWQQNPAIAQALGLLNRKISIMAAHYPQGEDPPVDSHKELLANVSGCGIAFHCVDPLPAGTRLHVSVVIKPSNIDVHFTATVIACEPTPNNPAGNYWLRIEIDEDNNAAREQLVQHVVQRQCGDSYRMGVPQESG